MKKKVMDELLEALCVGIPVFSFTLSVIFYLFGNTVGIIITGVIFVILSAVLLVIIDRYDKKKKHKQNRR